MKPNPNRVRRETTTAATASHPQTLVRESTVEHTRALLEAHTRLEKCRDEIVAFMHLLTQSYESQLKEAWMPETMPHTEQTIVCGIWKMRLDFEEALTGELQTLHRLLANGGSR